MKFAGLLSPLEAPHHPNLQQALRYREGVTLDKEGSGTLIDIGMYRRARLEKLIQPGVRVTIELPEPLAAADTRKGQKPITVKAVSPKTPREKAGHYWGYHIRLASSFSRVITESPYEVKYYIYIYLFYIQCLCLYKCYVLVIIIINIQFHSILLYSNSSTPPIWYLFLGRLRFHCGYFGSKCA